MAKCKISYCDSTTIRARGICMKHYVWLSHEVKRGKYTWDDLERIEVVNPTSNNKASQARKMMEIEIERKMHEYERKNTTEKK